MNRLLSKEWWIASGTRAIKTFFQAMVATIGTSSAMIQEVNWIMVLGTAGLSALLSLFTSLAGLPEVKEEEK